MSIRRNFTKYILSLFLCLGTIFATSCDIMYNPVKGFFDDSMAAFRKSNNQADPDAGGYDYTSEFDNIDLTTALVYYVSPEGDDDENDGTKEKPLKTLDKALSELKTNLDSQKTNGYVLLLNDFVISEEINLETYRFDQLSPDVVDLTIAGYGARRKIDAESGSRVMKVGYTNGNLTFKNLVISGGYSDDAGGAGMYITSTSCGGKTCVIENCIFTENMSMKSGAAIALETEYKVEIKKSQITANNGYDGAAAIDLKYITGVNNGLVLIISDTVIDDNHSHVTTSLSTYDYGFVLNTSGLSIAQLAGGVVIKNNTIDSVPPESDYSKLCAVQTVSGLELSGANTIQSNQIGLGDASGTEYTRNMILGRTSTTAETTTPTIYITGNCEGSSIGVSLPYTKDNPVSITNAVTFTSDYTSSGNTASPGSIFVSDCQYGIGYNSDESEAAFVLSSGGMGSPLDYTVNFTVFPPVIPTGKASSITVTPKVMKGTEDVSSTVTGMTFTLKLMDSSTVAASSSTNTLSVSAARALPGTYSLSVTAEWNGIAYDDTVSIVCRDALEGMIYVSGASISGAIADSGVFVTGRNLTIPSLYASDHELTQREYKEYCYYAYSDNSYNNKIPQSGYLGDNYPACFISWYDSIVYCNLRSMAEGLTPAYSMDGETDPRKWAGIESGSGTDVGKYCGPYNITTDWDNNIEFDTSANGWRMPTEAEWEYLARGGNLDSASQTTYAGSNNWEEVAWAGEGSTSTPHVVKQKAANSLGLYDMSGNVYEYVWDWFGGVIDASVGAKGCTTPIMTYKTNTGAVTLTPTTIVRGNARMVRGGAYNYGSNEAKVSDRSVNNTPEMRWANCGVRIVRNQN